MDEIKNYDLAQKRKRVVSPFSFFYSRRFYSILCLLFIAFFYFVLPEIGFAEMYITQDIGISSYQVSGNRDRSFYPDNKTRYLNEGTVTFNESVEDKNGEFYGNISYRLTNDVIVDTKDASIEQMSIGYRDKKTIC